jgi:hypothetical protein
MRTSDVPIVTPCGADWSEMTAVEARARLCAACDKKVHDLSAMDEGAVRELRATGPLCVRYLYDRHGKIIFGALPEGTKVVPAAALLSKVAKSKWLAAAAVAASAIVFEACGGASGDVGQGGYLGGFERDKTPTPSPQPDPERRFGADASVNDGAVTETDGGTDPDAGP